ncbi:MAG: hypothetical protein ACLRIS_15665 [Flavonifractor plautii]
MIEAKHVRYGIRSREILRGVDFRVEKGVRRAHRPQRQRQIHIPQNVYKVLRPQAGS